jgi:3-oxoacyl-[acyl-carrier-protein] synthase II
MLLRVFPEVVITGIGAVTPIGITRGEIVANLRAGRCGLARRVFDGPVEVWFGSVPRNVGDHFGRVCAFLDPASRELALADEQLPFALLCAEQALGQSGLEVTDSNRQRIGIVVSSSKGLLRNMIRAHILLREKGPQGAGKLLADLMMNFPGDTLGRHIARKYGISGPIQNHPTACATGATSIIAAVNLIRDGYIDAAIAGSSESSGNAVTLASFLNMGAISPDRTRPFHRDRAGFNPGEGAGVFVLERGDLARARGARILGTVSGWDFRSDAYHITAVETDGHVVEHAIREALRRADWSPDTVDYISAHGTGTALNDSTEAAVIARVFGAPGPLVSSIKSYIGHLLGGSASTELAIAMMSLEDGFVPPTLGLDAPDPDFHLRFVPDGGIEMRARRMLKFSLGFGGHIAVMAVELPQTAPV